MIPYERTRQQTIPNSAVKIIGVGGAGANMLDRIALDGMEGAELLACNTDVRTLTSSVAPEKIQIGRNLTKGLGAGGDPDLGRQAAGEAELELRDALRDRKIIFICVGLGGGTGSGAAPLVARLAREGGAFTVVFATTPFNFEGRRRREQAENALKELSVLANALITFDNTRMGELVLAKQGVHEAFSAADRMISESIRAVTRIVMRPGLVNIGLDDLMAALSSPKSRCLFGSGIAQGENRAQQALKNALVSPLLDRGSLLHHTETVLVHVCGGEDMTLYELELLMRGLSKHVPDTAQILFGTSVDPAMGESLSVTLVSSLPEDRLLAGLSSEGEGAPSSHAEMDPDSDDAVGQVDETEEAAPESAGSEAREPDVPAAEAAPMAKAVPPPLAQAETPLDPEPIAEIEPTPEPEPAPEPELAPEPEPTAEPEPAAEAEGVSEPERSVPEPESMPEPISTPEPVSGGKKPRKGRKPRVKVKKMKPPGKDEVPVGGLSDDTPVKLPAISPSTVPTLTTRVKLPTKRSGASPLDDVFDTAKGTDLDSAATKLTQVADFVEADNESEVVSFESVEPSEGLVPIQIEALEEIQASAKKKRPQGELLLDGGPKGKFEGEDPNLIEGEDLDIPPFLRNKK